VLIKAVLLPNRYLKNAGFRQRAIPPRPWRRSTAGVDGAAKRANECLLEFGAPGPDGAEDYAHCPNWGFRISLMSTPTPPTERLSIST
jgi:hypothetical protein